MDFSHDLHQLSAVGTCTSHVFLRMELIAGKKMRRSCWVSWAGFPLDRGWILQKLDLQFVDLLAIVQACFAMSCPWLKLQHHLMKSLFPMLHAGGVPICFCTRLSEQGLNHLIVISHKCHKFLGPTSTLSSSCESMRHLWRLVRCTIPPSQSHWAEMMNHCIILYNCIIMYNVNI